MVKTWWILLVLAAVFVLVGGGLVVGVLAADGPVGVLVVGIVLALVGLGLAAPVPAVRRQQHVGVEEDLRDVAPAPVDPTTPRPWSPEQVAGELAAALADAPYVVQQAPGRIRVRADLADARFVSLGGLRRVKQVVAHDVVVEGPGRCATVDRSQGLSWTAGVDGSLRPRLSGSATAFSGKAWSRSYRKEYGVGLDGSVGAQVDWKFDLAELQEPTRAVLEKAGWKVRWPAEARVALVVAGIGASSLVLVPLAFLVVWLVG